jgi:hypothetical protein
MPLRDAWASGSMALLRVREAAATLPRRTRMENLVNHRTLRLLMASLTLSLTACLEIDKDDDDDDEGDDTGISLGEDDDGGTDDDTDDDTDGDSDDDTDDDDDGGTDDDTDDDTDWDTDDDPEIEFTSMYTSFTGRVSQSSGGYSFDPATNEGSEIAAYFYVVLASDDWDGDLQNNETACILYFLPDASNTTEEGFSSADQSPSSAWVGFVMDSDAYYDNSGGACAYIDADAYGTGITWGFGFSAIDTELDSYFEENWDEYDDYSDNMVGGWVYVDSGDGGGAYNMNYGFAYELDGGQFVIDDAGDYGFWDTRSWSDIEEDTYFSISPGYGFGL